MVSKTVCSACGSDSAQEGARFCPSCGSRPLKDVSVNESTVEASTVTFDEAIEVPGPTELTAPDQTPAESQSRDSSESGLFCANCFLNPTSDMLEQAQIQATGGILFVGTYGSAEGKFTLPSEIGVGRIRGGDKIDLSYADFVHPVTTITTGIILGGLKVVVPRGVRVEVRGIGILGGFKGLNGQTVHAGQDVPVVVIQGLSILGGVEVSVNESVPPIRIIK